MTPSPRFCTSCGAPLSPGARFCEQCGQPAEGSAGAGLQPEAGPAVPAVIPFASSSAGMFSRKDLVLVITSDALVEVSLPRELAGEMNRLRGSLEKTLENGGISGRDFWEASSMLSPGLPRAYLAPRKVPGELTEQVKRIRSALGLPGAPWTRFSGMEAKELLAEFPGSTAIPLAGILYVRGEDLVEGEYGEDLLVVRTREQEFSYRLGLGCFYPARSTLFKAIGNLHGLDPSGEPVAAIVPVCFEPGPKDFGFQYTFNLVFTQKRLILAISPGGEDEVEEAWNTYITETEKAARKAGQPVEDYRRSTGWNHAPWQIFRDLALPEILDADGVNYFIPYSSLERVLYTPGRKPTISLVFPGQYSIVLDADREFAPDALRTAQNALQGAVSITL